MKKHKKSITVRPNQFEVGDILMIGTVPHVVEDYMEYPKYTAVFVSTEPVSDSLNLMLQLDNRSFFQVRREDI